MAQSPAITPPSWAENYLPTGEIAQRVEPGVQNVLGSLWLQALQNYKDKTGVDPLTHPLIKDLAGCSSAGDVMRLFDSKMKEFENFRGDKDSRWRELRDKWLKPAVETVIFLTDALAEVASFFPVVPGGKAIFVAFGALLAATEGMSKRYDALMDLFQQIPFFLESASVRDSRPQNWGTATRSVTVAILVHLLEIFALAVQTTSGSWRRLAHYGKSLMRSTDMQKALEHMKELTRLETRAIASETRVVAATILQDTEKLVSLNTAYSTLFHDLVGKMEDAQFRAEEEYGQAQAARIRDQQEHEQIRCSQAEAAANVALGRLGRLDLADLVAQDRPGCLAGTRVAVLSDLSAWSRNPDAPRIYWLNGMAGTGKSAIARSFGRQLQKDDTLGGSFFCSRESVAELMNAKRIIPTLAAALAGRYGLYRTALLSCLDRYSAEPSPSAWALNVQVERLLIEPFARFVDDIMPDFVLLIDALDETADTRVHELLYSLVSASKRIPLKLFLTSRPEEYIRLHLGPMKAILRLHDIEKEIVSSDIHRYVRFRVDGIVKRFKSTGLPAAWPPDTDVCALADLADCLFIHAFTTTEYISGGNPVKRLKDVLSISHTPMQRANPLSDLDRIYKFILASVHGDEEETALTWRILTAILTVKVTLTMDNMSKLLGIETYELVIALRQLHAVIYVPDSIDRGALSTFHASFGDFLTDPFRAPPAMLIVPVQGHLDLLKCCVAIMDSHELHFDMCRSRTSYRPSQLIDIPLHVTYACMHWLNHVHNLHTVIDPHDEFIAVYASLEKVLMSKCFFWVEVCAKCGMQHLFDTLTGFSKSSVIKHFSKDIIQLFFDLSTLLSENPETIENLSHLYLSTLAFQKPSSFLSTLTARDFARFPSHRITYTQSMKSRDEELISVDCSPQGDHVLTGSSRGQMYQWDARTGELLQTIEIDRGNRVRSVQYSPDGSQIITSTYNGTICIWNANTGELTRELLTNGSYGDIHAAFSPNGKAIAAIVGSSLYVWRTSSRYWTQTKAGMEDIIYTMAFSPCGRYIVTGSSGGTLHIWDLECPYFQSPLLKGLTQKVTSAAFSPDGVHIVAGSEDGHTCVWNAASGATVHIFEKNEPISAVVYSQKYIILGTETAIHVYDSDTKAVAMPPLEGHLTPVTSLRMFPDGTRLASSASDSTVCIWDLDNHSEICRNIMNGRFDHFFLPSSRSDYLRGPNQEQLLCIPKQYKEFIQHPPCIVRIGERKLTMDWSDTVHGEDWTKCYIGS